jgi:glycosyltransferase involved in cell wall biosynthesis
MSILHIIDHFSLGGAQRIVEGILGVMPEALILPLRKKGDDPMQIVIQDNRYLLKPADSLVRQIPNLLKVPGYIKRQNIKIVHCHLHNSWIFGLWILLWMSPKNAPRLIFHEHDSVKLHRWYYSLWVRLLSHVGTFIAVSYFIQQKIVACGIPIEKVHLLRNFVDLDRFSPGDKSAASDFGIDPRKIAGSKIIGFAGRLVEYKGWRIILKVAEKLPEVRFLIAGQGQDAGKLIIEIHQLGLENRVFFLGYINNMKLFYNSIDVLIIPSLREAFGLVQLEAQASGTPVVVFDSEAALEIHGNNSSVLVRSGDIEMLTQKIKELLGDPEYYREMVNKGLANARLYNLQAYIEQLNCIYRVVLNQ